MKIVADAHIPFVEDYFGGYGELILKNGREINAGDVADADILLVRSITPVNQALLKDSRVKFVGSVTAGADHLDTHWMDAAGIVWSVAAGFNAPPVADYVTAIVAALHNKRELCVPGGRAAVVGVGNVGKLVASRLQTLGMEVALCDPLRAQREPDFQSVNLADFADFDLISLHVPLVKTGEHPTYHFINRTFLQQQKPGCILLNASRGAVINSSELITHGGHLRWCLDVWEGEPNINKIILESAHFATPHIAGYSVQSKIRGIEMIYRIACDKKIIVPHAIEPLAMPRQCLAFSGIKHHWQDIVLGIFNPRIMTMLMQTALLPAGNAGLAFDKMRNGFNYRHEFNFVDVQADVLPADQLLLQRLGIAMPMTGLH